MLNPRSLAARVRRAIEAYTKATGIVPVVEFEGGDRFTLKAPSQGATDSEDGRNLQRELDGAFKS